MNIKQVAKKARVSTATVSRIINDSSLVSPETARRVWRTIRQLNYHPDSQARGLVSGRSRILGLIISDITNPFFPELVKGFENLALQNNYEVILNNTNYDPARMATCVRRLLERRAEGVAIMTSEMDPELTDELAKRSIPIVFLDVGSVRDRISNIRVDYAQGIREAVDHLITGGHRRIGFISGPMSLKSACTRKSAFLKCWRAYGFSEDSDLIVEGNHKIDGGASAMSRLLQLTQRPTAILASNDLSAIGALGAIRLAGLRIPEDISVVGFDDIDFGQFTHPPLATIRLSRTELGGKAFNALYRVLHGDSKKGEEYNVETHFVARESTGPAPKLGRETQ